MRDLLKYASLFLLFGKVVLYLRIGQGGMALRAVASSDLPYGLHKMPYVAFCGGYGASMPFFYKVAHRRIYGFGSVGGIVLLLA